MLNNCNLNGYVKKCEFNKIYEKLTFIKKR